MPGPSGNPSDPGGPGIRGGMQVRVVTLRFDPVLEAFDDSPLQELLKGREVFTIRDRPAEWARCEGVPPCTLFTHRQLSARVKLRPGSPAEGFFRFSTADRYRGVSPRCGLVALLRHGNLEDQGTQRVLRFREMVGITVSDSRRINIGAWNSYSQPSSVEAKVFDASGRLLQTIGFELKRYKAETSFT